MSNVTRIIGLLLLPLISYSQGNQIRMTVPAVSGTDSALLYLPDDYNGGTKLYPLLLFAHGNGESGNNLSKIYTSSTAGGPAYLIYSNQWPSSFTNPVTGASEKFIVITPQSKTGYVNGDDMDVIIQYMVKSYRVDPTRISGMGISLGGGGLVEYGCHMAPDQKDTTHYRKYLMASAILLSAATNSPQKWWGNLLANGNFYVWGHGDPNNDVYGEFTMDVCNYENAAKSGIAIWTPNTYGHGGWQNIFTPKYTLNGQSVYQFLLSKTQTGGTTSTNPPPVTVPPIKAVLLQDSTVLNPPHSVVVLTDSTRYADTSNPGGTYLQVSGPTKAIFTPGTGRQMYVSNLQPGTYTFQLIAMNGDVNAFTVDSAKVSVTVKPIPSCPPPIICPVPRTAISVQAMIGTTLIALPLNALKIGYNDGTTQP